jgi:hypothetical protein
MLYMFPVSRSITRFQQFSLWEISEKSVAVKSRSTSGKSVPAPTAIKSARGVDPSMYRLSPLAVPEFRNGLFLFEYRDCNRSGIWWTFFLLGGSP